MDRHKSDYLFFQFVIQYSNVYQASISLVITVDSVSAYTVFKMKWLLIANRTLLRTKNSSDGIDMRATIDERVKDIALKFGSQVPKSKFYRFPKDRAFIPRVHSCEALLVMKMRDLCCGTFRQFPFNDLLLKKLHIGKGRTLFFSRAALGLPFFLASLHFNTELGDVLLCREGLPRKAL